MSTKLNLGCGDLLFKKEDGWINVDLFNPAADLQADVKKLPFKDNSVDEIYNCHLIEHFTFWDSFEVLKEWERVLKPGAWLVTETCDFLASCKKFVESNEQGRIGLYGHFFAYPCRPGQTHYFLYTETQLKWNLEQAGFKNCERLPAKRYIGMEDVCLKIACQKEN